MGDKVAANFCTDHLSGDTSAKINATALGGGLDGVLRQYVNLPAHVSPPSAMGYGSLMCFVEFGGDTQGL